jgi:AraC-like DNA-binding protein
MQKLVDMYMGAWNRRDLKGLLELMHEGVSYYDAFWRETCVGRDLTQYLQDCFESETSSYQQIGKSLQVQDGVVFRYAAHNPSDGEAAEPSYVGAEVLTLLDGKILTISDHYCDPQPALLEEVARLAARRHGESRYANSGLGALKSWIVREQLMEMMEKDQVFLDPELTLANVARHIGCSDEQLLQVITRELGTDFDDIVEVNRTNFAGALLLHASNEPNYMSHIAAQSGFSSKAQFLDAFAKFFGMTPKEYQRINARS